MVVARTSLAFTCAVSRASSSSRIPIERGFAARLVLHLGEELPLRFLGGEAGDGLELAALLVERGAEALLLLEEHLLLLREGRVLRREIGEASLDVGELARELLVLRDRALLDLLDLALAAADLGLEVPARLERALPQLELRRLAPVLRVALRVVHDALRALTGLAEPLVGDPLVQEEPDQEGENADDGIDHEPESLGHRLPILGK